MFVAGLLEVGWAIGLKYTEGFSKVLPSVVTVALMIASFNFLALALKTLPIGTAYAVWTGIGAAGTAVLGILLLEESGDVLRVLSIALILVGVVGLRLSSSV